MYCPSLEEFLKLSQKGNVIPVYKEINADLDTPVSAFLKIKKGDYAFLLESVEGQENVARYSFLGSNPSFVFESKGENISIIYAHKSRRRSFLARSGPLSEIKKIMRDFKPVEIAGLPRFCGGLVGYLGYDTVRFFEDIPDKNPDSLSLPDSVFMLTDTILVFDHVNHLIKIVSNVILSQDKNKASVRIKAYKEALRKIEAIEGFLNKPLPKVKSSLTAASGADIVSNFREEDFCSIVKKAKGYIRRGDIIQVVLSQRFKLKIKKGAFDIYRSLRSLNPSPYMFFLKLRGLSLLGASPEMLLRCEEGKVATMPIAGTRPRGRDKAQDKKLEEQLKKSSKEKAEHIMLVDLSRNDLGRVCKAGRVITGELMRVEKYSHVMHLVSEVSGPLAKGRDAYDALKACFPAGTVSGSPKIRAMQIIDELENSRRGPYAGCVGYFSFSHNLDTCITIRTVVIKDGIAYIQAGAGIVADSSPKKEYRETVNKARALIEAALN